MKNRKHINRIFVGAAIFILVALTVIFYFMISAENKLFKEKGISVKATVIEMWQIKHKSKRSVDIDYYCKVAFFTKDTTATKSPVNKLPDTTKSSADAIIDKIFENIDLSIGDYTTADCLINSTVYNDLNVGDSLQIIYISDDPERVKMDIK